jgi:ParB family chromosome partitioning protein
MTKLPEGKTRLDLVRGGLVEGGLKKRGRLIVNVDRLLEDPKNERKTFRNLQGLIASIQTLGLIEPITVTPEEGSDTYRIVTGHRRYRAAKAAGLSQVEILIREPEDAITRRLKSIVSNVQREDVGPIEMAEALQSLMDEDARIKTQRQLAKVIGKAEGWVSEMLNLLTLPAPVRLKLQTSEVSLSYDAVTKIARVEEPTLQEELVNAITNGATVRDIRSRIGQATGKQPTAASHGESTPPKPKRVFHTTYKATVIVQAKTLRLSNSDIVQALKEALKQAVENE